MNYRTQLFDISDILDPILREIATLDNALTRDSDWTRTIPSTGLKKGTSTIFPNNARCAGERKPTVSPYEINSILANHAKGAFTVVWADGTHTMIHLQEGDVWDNEKALAMCFVKKLMGNTGKFNEIFTEVMPSRLKEIPSKKKENTVADCARATTTSFSSRCETIIPNTPKTGPVQLVMTIDRTDLNEDEGEDDSFTCDFQC